MMGDEEMKGRITRGYERKEGGRGGREEGGGKKIERKFSCPPGVN